jgi:tetratricopeptide (TPR) repeat protein
MAARSLVDGGLAASAEPLLARRGAQAQGPSLLLEIQEILDAAGRYREAIDSAERLGAAYPLSAERVAAEAGAASAMRKAGREEESHSRRAGFYALFGPGSPWQGADGRTREEIERSNLVSEEGLRDALHFLHTRARGRGVGDREKILSLYSAYADHFPGSPKACDVAGGNAWLLQEMGRKKEAGRVFEASACTSDRAREEVARYMALQCAKDVSSPSDPDSMAEIVRLGTDYERSFPRGFRVGPVLLDRARAHFHLKEYPAAAEDARRAEAGLAERKERIAAVRLAGESLFQAGDFAGAEAAFRSALAIALQPEERKDVQNWIGFSMFRLAESYPPEKAGEAADLFLAIAREFPALETAPVARFRAGASYEEAGRVPEAVDALLPLESGGAPGPLQTDATRRLARLFEQGGRPVPAAERYARLAAAETAPSEKRRLLLRAAELFEAGEDWPAARKNFSAVASLPGTPAGVRGTSLFRAAENARLGGQAAEADRLYADAVSAHRDDPAGAAEIAGKALFRRAEYRSREYASLPIAPPLEKSFRRKRSSLEACALLYLEAARAGDPETVAASLHRLGELLEDFRSAILASPVPKRLSPEEREEYAFLLEEKAAAMEEKAVDSYLRNLHQAVEADFPSGWVESSIGRLKALRPARPDIRDIRKETP